MIVTHEISDTHDPEVRRTMVAIVDVLRAFGLDVRTSPTADALEIETDGLSPADLTLLAEMITPLSRLALVTRHGPMLRVMRDWHTTLRRMGHAVGVLDSPDTPSPAVIDAAAAAICRARGTAQ